MTYISRESKYNYVSTGSDTDFNCLYLFLVSERKVHIISGIVKVNLPTILQLKHQLFRRCYVLPWRNHYFSPLFSLTMKSSTRGVMQLNLYHNCLRLFYFIIFCVPPPSLPHPLTFSFPLGLQLHIMTLSYSLEQKHISSTQSFKCILKP